MLATRWSEFFDTGRLSTRWFHGLLDGKIGHAGAPGSGCADTKPGTTTYAGAAMSAQHPSNTRRRRMAVDYRWRGGGSGSPGQTRCLRHYQQPARRDPKFGHGRFADV